MDAGRGPFKLKLARTKAVTEQSGSPGSAVQLIPCHGIEQGAHKAAGNDQMLVGLEVSFFQSQSDPPAESNKSWRADNSAMDIFPIQEHVTSEIKSARSQVIWIRNADMVLFLFPQYPTVPYSTVLRNWSRT
jgi:hypothetical protein